MSSKYSNLEAETEVLGTIFLDNNAMISIYDYLQVEDFENISHKLIYDGMRKLFKDGKAIEPVILYETLGEKAKEAKGLTYFCELMNGAVSSASIMSYADIVKNKSFNRKLQRTLTLSLNSLQVSDKEGKELVEDLKNHLFLCDNDLKKEANISDDLCEYLNYIEEVYKKGGDITGITTGKKALDNVMGGFMPQDFVIIAGRPSMGKSAVALNLALGASIKQDAKVAFFSLEMSKNQCMGRVVSMYSKIPLKNLKQGRLSDEEWSKFIAVSNDLSKLNLYIYDDVLNLSTIINKCKKLKIQKGLDIVFIDYIQNVCDDSIKGDNRSRELSIISRTLKLLAKELNITIVALSQLSRASEARIDHRPIMSDLRESGALEQDADVVIGVYRDGYYNVDEYKDKLELIVLKNRNGETGTLKFKWNGDIQKMI